MLTFSANSQQLTQAEKVMGVSMVWQEVNYNFAFFDQVENLDWDAEYMQTIEAVSKTKCDVEYYKLLKQFIAKLNDGHTNVYYPEWIENRLIRPSFSVFRDNQNYYFTTVPKKLKRNIPQGAQLLSVNGQNVDDYLEEYVFPYISSSTAHAKESFALQEMFVGLPDTKFKIAIRTDSDNKETIEFQLEERLVDGFEADNHELMNYITDEGVYYLSLPSFENEAMIPEVRSLISDINNSKGLILDLRENIGGLGVVALNIAQHFIQSDELITMPWKSRQHIASLKAWGNSGLQLVGYETVDQYKDYGDLDAWISIESDTLSLDPARKIINVPIVILTSERTASAAENFLIYTKQNDEIITVGTRTFGSTGQPIYFTLPGGAIARVCTKKNYDIDGTEFVGYGIQPNYVKQMTLSDKLNDTDSQLEKAIQIVSKMSN